MALPTWICILKILSSIEMNSFNQLCTNYAFKDLKLRRFLLELLIWINFIISHLLLIRVLPTLIPNIYSYKAWTYLRIEKLLISQVRGRRQIVTHLRSHSARNRRRSLHQSLYSSRKRMSILNNYKFKLSKGYKLVDIRVFIFVIHLSSVV